MLSILHIENIAVIEKAEIEFSYGLNVMTGETGAGKSIVIDAIGAVLGQRTSRELIRTGAESAQVTAIFCDLPKLSWFEENDIEPDEDGNLLIMRRLSADGKNSCRVNGRPTTVAQLKALGREILNIHGQHDSLQMFDEGYQLKFIDGFGDISLEEYIRSYNEYREILREMESLSMDEAEKERRKDILSFQIDELERANLKVGEDEELESRRALLKNAAKLMDCVQQAYFAFNGDDYTDGIYAGIMNAEHIMTSGALNDLGESAQKLVQSTTELRLNAGDILERLRDLKNELEYSPEEYDEIETRLDILRRLSRKYGGSVPEMLEYLEKCRVELDNIEYASDRLERLNKQLEIKRAECEKLASELSEKRKASALRLKERILDELRQLDMPKVRLDIVFSEKTMDSKGIDAVSFEMSTNPGENLRPINKIASGGELSRIMLALKTVLAENDEIGTLIFDEVDSGVSGKAAQKVGAKLREVAQYRQVISVTHLPQVAACADTHLKIVKNTDGERTDIKVFDLSRDERIEEVARIISGENITEASRVHAEEMIDLALGKQRP
ncbi:MAG: DNA repair protein RecN [Clostridiales bacterium]|nr:DNA repair protein RecN [Clostridiales bacterium]